MRDLQLALEIAEEYLDKGDWVNISTTYLHKAIHMEIGTVWYRPDEWRESPYLSIMIQDGVVRKHAEL